ncbi:MAG: hypothetical protein Q9226_002648 [Calogaya cf. arnoldii]
MDNMAAILLEFDSHELTVLSYEGQWGSFRSALQDVEAITTARIYLPEGHVMQLRLQGILQSFLTKLQTQHNDAAVLKTTCRSPITQEASGCRDPPAHRGLLKAWMELDSDDADKKAVEESIRVAFLSHSRPKRQAIAASGGQEEDPLFVPICDEHQQNQPFSFRVESLKFGEGPFKNADVDVSHKPPEKILEFDVLSGDRNSRLDVETKRRYNLKYSTSKKQVALEQIHREDNHILDIHLYSTREGEILIEKIKVLDLVDCPHTGYPSDLAK